MSYPLLILLTLPLSVKLLIQPFSLENNKSSSSPVLSSPFFPMDFLHLVVDCLSFASVWNTLEHVLAYPSNYQIMELYGSFHNLCQGDDIIAIYL